MSRDESAISLGYKNDKERMLKLEDKEYCAYLSRASKFLGTCYRNGDMAYRGETPLEPTDEELTTCIELLKEFANRKKHIKL